MIIRRCESDELRKVARLHIECFPDSFSTALGRGGKGRLLERYYYEYYKRVPELFFVAEDEGEIVGLCMGFYCEWENYSREFLKNNLFRIALRMFWLLLSGNKAAWKKMASVFLRKKANHHSEVCDADKKRVSYSAKERAEILSVCVSPAFRGTTVATDLMNAFLDEARHRNRKICGLTVIENNKRAIAFYEKMGFCQQAYIGESIHMIRAI